MLRTYYTYEGFQAHRASAATDPVYVGVAYIYSTYVGIYMATPYIRDLTLVTGLRPSEFVVAVGII